MPDAAGSPSTARDRAAKSTPPRFGAILRAEYASEGNPQRDGMFVRVVRIPRGRMNAGVWWEITDGNGTFWRQRPANVSVLGHGPLAEVEQLLPVVEAAAALVDEWPTNLPFGPYQQAVVDAVAAYRAGGSAPHQGATTDVAALLARLAKVERVALSAAAIGLTDGEALITTAEVRALLGAGGTPDETGHHPR